MKVNIMKRFSVLVMTVLMLFATSVSAFAAEAPAGITENTAAVADVESTRSSIMDRYDFGDCPPFGTLTLTFTLDSYKFSQEIYFLVNANESDTTPSGYALVELFKPNGDKLDSFYADPEVEEYYGDYHFLSAGRYKVVVHSYVGETLHCTAGLVG